MRDKAGLDVIRRAFSDRVWPITVLLIGLGVVAYSNSLTDLFVGYNAKRSIRDNPDIQQLWPLWRAMSLHLVGTAAVGDGGTLVRRPVLSLSFAVNQTLFGRDAWGSQATNTAIHIAAGLALFGLMRRTLDRRWLAFAVAAVWLVHPLQTECVSYIPQRAESLMGLFFFLTLYCAIRSWEGESRALRVGTISPCAGGTTGGGSKNITVSRGWQAAALLSCALGMASKEAMVAAPIMVFLYDGIFVSGSYGAALARRRAFYLALASTWAILIALLVATWGDVILDFRQSRMVPYALSQPQVVLHYLRLAFWPDPLFLYVNTSEFWFHIDGNAITTFAFPASIILLLLVATVYGLLRRHWLGFFGVWFFVFLAPTSTIVATSDVIQEHRMYVSLAAVVALVVIATDHAIRRLASSGNRESPIAGLLDARLVAGAILVTVLIAEILATRARNVAYHSEFGAYAPGDLPAAYGVTASYEFVRGNLSAADELFEAMLALRLPDGDSNFGQSLFQPARVLNALGAVRALQGRMSEARTCFEQALAVRPSFAVAENNLGVVSLLQGSLRDARMRFEKALMSDPALTPAHISIALVYLLEQNQKLAAEHLARARQSDGASGIREPAIPIPRVDAIRREDLTFHLTFLNADRPFDYLLYLTVRDQTRTSES